MNKNILVITRNAWNDEISTGNTATNIFSNWDRNNIANLFCRAEKPNNNICNLYYRITESDLIRNIIFKKEVGKIAYYNELAKENSKDVEDEKKLYDFFRNNRFYILIWAREVLWYIAKWQNKKLYDFIIDFNPELIYMPVYDSLYMHNILHYVQEVTNAKIVLFTSDDIYSLKRFSVSPLFWINRLIQRRKIRESFKMADIVYSQSEAQILELKKEFGDKFKILRKGVANKTSLPIYNEPGEVIKLVYTGNIIYGRWRTLALLGRAIQSINSDKIRIQLYIYSANKLTRKLKKELNIGEHVKFMGAISPEMVHEVQQKADVLVHVEAFDIKNKLAIRHSFSTKIVDYFQNGRCILAIGPQNNNSIQYLAKNDAALVATNKEMIVEKLNKIIENPSIISEYALKSWKCGQNNRQNKTIQNELYGDLKYLL